MHNVRKAVTNVVKLENTMVYGDNYICTERDIHKLSTFISP